MAEVPEVSICLPEDISTREFFGGHPYHNVICMVVYVCHTTGNFHLVFADKLKELDKRYGAVEVCPKPRIKPKPTKLGLGKSGTRKNKRKTA